MINKTEFERQMADFRERMKPRPMRPTVQLPDTCGPVDETGITAAMRDKLAKDHAA